MTTDAAYWRDYRRRNRERLNAQRRERRAMARARTDLIGLPREQAKASAEAVAKWSAETLRIPTPPKAGQPFLLDPWQVAFFGDALADDVREAGLAVARRNGKTFLIAVLCLAYLAGPLNRRYWRGAAVSLTGRNCIELRTAIEQIAAESGLQDKIDVRRSPFPGKVEGQQGASIDFLAADKASGHSVGLDVALIDEAGLLGEDQRGLWQAMATSTGGRDGRMVCFSVLGDGPMYAEMRKRAERPSTVWHEYCAPADCELDDEAAWAAANPGLATGTKSPSYMREAAAKALLSPSDQNYFRGYELNQPLNPSRETICAVADWAKCVKDGAAPTGPVYAAFDLGGSVSMGAFAAYWPLTGLLRVQCGLPATPDLKARGMGDGVGGRYLEMERQGCLKTYRGRVLPVADFLKDAGTMIEGHDLRGVGADRYRAAEALQAIEDASLPWPIQWRGTGAHQKADGSHDVRAFQRAVLQQAIAAPPNLAIESAIAESEIRRDPGGNPALEKSRKRGRIDALQASVIALGLAEIDVGYWRPRDDDDEAGRLLKIG